MIKNCPRCGNDAFIVKGKTDIEKFAQSLDVWKQLIMEDWIVQCTNPNCRQQMIFSPQTDRWSWTMIEEKEE